MTEKILDLGCGNRKTPGSTGLDIASLPGVDIVHDLNVFPYPIQEGTYDRIVLRHVIEHIPDTIKLMKEVHRIGKPGALVDVYTPHFTSINSYADPTHIHHFSLRMFDYFCGDTPHDYVLGIKFEMLARDVTFYPFYDDLPWLSYATFGMRRMAKNHTIFYERFLAFLFPINEISVTMRVLK